MTLFRKILVPTDFSDCAQQALVTATSLAEKLDAEVEILHVLWLPPPYVGTEVMAMPVAGGKDMQAMIKQRAEEQLDKLVDTVGKPWESRLTKRLSPGDPASEVVRVAEEGGHDLIIMGTHGRKGLTRLLLGSVAEKVVRNAECPVMTIRA